MYTVCVLYFKYVVIVYDNVLYVSKLISQYWTKHNWESDYNNTVTIQFQKRILINVIIFTGNPHAQNYD